MKIKTKKQLMVVVVGLGLVLIGMATALNRNGFTYRSGEPFDWPGLVFTFISLCIAASVFELLRRSQKMLRYNYVIYGLIWLLPVIFLTNGSGQQMRNSNVAEQVASPQASCAPGLLPRVCRNDTPMHVVGSDDSEATLQPGTTFQAGYLVMFIFYGTAGFAIYRSIRNRIKGYRSEDLFQ